MHTSVLQQHKVQSRFKLGHENLDPSKPEPEVLTWVHKVQVYPFPIQDKFEDDGMILKRKS